MSVQSNYTVNAIDYILSHCFQEWFPMHLICFFALVLKVVSKKYNQIRRQLIIDSLFEMNDPLEVLLQNHLEVNLF